MTKMRSILLGLALAGACTTTESEVTPLPDSEMVGDTFVMEGDEAIELVRRTHRNVRFYEELRQQGQMQQMVALRRTIGRAVDEDFPTFREVALKGEYMTPRNWAVTCLGFAVSKRTKARKALESLLENPDEEYWIIGNSVLALGVLGDPETNLSRIIPLVGDGNPEVRANAATALKDLFVVKETPRNLNAQYYAAIDSLVSLLHDPATTRGRRAAAWALANIHHPETVDHLISALSDQDEMVQIGGLYGIELLGDQRALDPVLEYLDKGPPDQAASWARKALASIAIKGGFTTTPGELQPLGTSAKLWRKWFRTARMK